MKHPKRAVCTTGCQYATVILACLFASLAIAEENPVELRNARFASEQELPAIPDDIDDRIGGISDDARSASREFVIVPLPSRNPVLGWTLAVPAMYLYRPSGEGDDGSPAWVTGAMGLYSENDSWMAGLFHRMNLRQDQWRIMAAGATGEINYDYFGIGGDPDTSIPISQSVDMFLLEVLFRVIPDVYVGLRSSTSRSRVWLNIPGDMLPPGTDLPDLGIDVDITTIAPRLKYDSRDNDFYPSEGSLAEGSVTLGREALGGDHDYEKYEVNYNGYRSVTGDGVLATRLALQYMSGDAPFFVYPAFGSGPDLRGYQAGSYRDRFLIAAQAEYRHSFGQRFGFVAFGGIGSTSGKFADWGHSLWSLGAGLRWTVAPKNGLRLRLDVARGRDDTEFYLGLGEAY